VNSQDPTTWPAFALCAEAETLPRNAGERLWQRKADGCRAYLTKELLMFRGGKPMRHNLAIAERMPSDWLLDGELVSPTQSVGECTSLVASRSWQSLSFQVFDALTMSGIDLRVLPYYKRWDALNQVLPNDMVEVHCLPNHEMPLIPEGWEGIVGKDLNARWQPGRTRASIKWKITGELQAVITGFSEGSGSWRHSVGKVHFGLANAQGEIVEVGVAGGLGTFDRRRFWATPEQFVGRECVIRHYGMNRNKLRNPIFVGLR
jgi:ATP-dependent DNA ligase